MAKKSITADFEFPRSWKDTIMEGDEFSVITQPYIAGLYMSLSGKSGTEQLALSWKDVEKLVKDLRNSPTVTELHIVKVGDYLSEAKLSLLKD